MGIEQRVEKLEAMVGTEFREPRFVVMNLCYGDISPKYPTEQEEEAKLAQMLQEKPGEEVYTAVWDTDKGEWR